MAVALVTGGTSGIGAAFARILAAQGYDLVLVARDVSRLENMAVELRALGRSVEVLRADLADRTDVDRVAARLEDPENPVQMLVNNAGFGDHTGLLEPGTAALDLSFEVMCRAVYVLSGAAARGMLPQGAGRIVNVSSTAGFLPMGAYSAIKAWVTTYTESLSVELNGTGVTTTALCPGWVRTEFHERAGISASKIPNFMWLDAEPLVTECLRDVNKGKVISIPTVRYRVLIWLARVAPKSWLRVVARLMTSSRRPAVAR
ncbi:SDR family NAD(P)-dependent oxidoreductase [soil metagenome]